MKRISVIVPCYNAAKWLPKCFMSFVQQTMGMEFLELIFVNDASTDDGQTWEMLEEFERAFPESVLIIDLPDNRRQGGARNAALQYASGEYIAFVDADDWIMPEMCEVTYEKAKEMDADIVQFGHRFYTDSVGIFDGQSVTGEACFRITSKEERKRFLMSEQITYGCWNKIYRRAMVEEAKVQYAEHMIYEEPLFVYPLLYYGKVYVQIPDKLYVYRQNEAGTMRKDMKRIETLLHHAKVQYAVWKFMQETAYFKEYYEEIKLYFLHTYYYETLYFAKLRGMELPSELIEELQSTVLKEVEDLDFSVYEKIIPRQMELYRMTKQGMTKEMLSAYMEKL